MGNTTKDDIALWMARIGFYSILIGAIPLFAQYISSTQYLLWIILPSFTLLFGGSIYFTYNNPNIDDSWSIPVHIVNKD